MKRMNHQIRINFLDRADECGNSHLRLRQLSVVCILSPALLFGIISVKAGSATWSTNPVSSEWNLAANWMPNTVPNGPGDTATFGSSNTVDLSLTGSIETNRIVFNSGASAFTVSSDPAGTFSSLRVTGLGITNNSGTAQNFVALTDAAGGQGTILFTNSASAGTLTTFINQANPVAGIDGGLTDFVDKSSAGSGIFVNEGATVSGGSPGRSDLFEHATGAEATFINHGGAVEGGPGGITQFLVSASAGTATLIADGGSNGGGGGQIVFWDSSGGGSARLELFGNGFLNLAPHNGAVNVGSIEGDGFVQLWGHTLSVGSNNVSTAFSGVIEEGSSQTSGGAITKIGIGSLTLTGPNTFTGTTNVAAGTLIVSNGAGSGTGTGAVKINAGTLGGKGIIAGATTIGTGSGGGAFLAPAVGSTKQATLTIQSALTFNSDATYTYTFKAKQNKAKTDKVVANGVTINGDTLSLVGQTQGSLKQGLRLMLISNTSANPISGTFSNLPDGGIVTINGNNFQANYEGGDGNDLTLTVVP